MKQQNGIYLKREAKSKRNFPNTASRSYRLNKIVDYLLTLATTFGIVVAILFLVTL